jgi:hypothetical protein
LRENSTPTSDSLIISIRNVSRLIAIAESPDSGFVSSDLLLRHGLAGQAEDVTEPAHGHSQAGRDSPHLEHVCGLDAATSATLSHVLLVIPKISGESCKKNTVNMQLTGSEIRQTLWTLVLAKKKHLDVGAGLCKPFSNCDFWVYVNLLFWSR